MELLYLFQNWFQTVNLRTRHFLEFDWNYFAAIAHWYYSLWSAYLFDFAIAIRWSSFSAKRNFPLAARTVYTCSPNFGNSSRSASCLYSLTVAYSTSSGSEDLRYPLVSAPASVVIKKSHFCHWSLFRLHCSWFQFLATVRHPCLRPCAIKWSPHLHLAPYHHCLRTCLEDPPYSFHSDFSHFSRKHFGYFWLEYFQLLSLKHQFHLHQVMESGLESQCLNLNFRLRDWYGWAEPDPDLSLICHFKCVGWHPGHSKVCRWNYYY